VMAPDFSARASSDFDWDFGFQGQFRDAETGWYDYGYRFYVPRLGRWIKRDPIEEGGGVNLYGFVRNDPVNGWDYLGESPLGPPSNDTKPRTILTCTADVAWECVCDHSDESYSAGETLSAYGYGGDLDSKAALEEVLDALKNKRDNFEPTFRSGFSVENRRDALNSCKEGIEIFNENDPRNRIA